MTIPKVGEYWKRKGTNTVYLVHRYYPESKKVRVIREECYTKERYSVYLENFLEDFEPCFGYNTPLWRILNDEAD